MHYIHIYFKLPLLQPQWENADIAGVVGVYIWKLRIVIVEAHYVQTADREAHIWYDRIELFEL